MHLTLKLVLVCSWSNTSCGPDYFESKPVYGGHEFAQCDGIIP